MLAVAAGLSLGKEGPMVHIAICLGKRLQRNRALCLKVLKL